MKKTSSSVKRKYNSKSYRRYEFSVNVDSKLNYTLEKYKENPKNNLSGLLKDLLCTHFGLTKANQYDVYVPIHFYHNRQEVPRL